MLTQLQLGTQLLIRGNVVDVRKQFGYMLCLGLKVKFDQLTHTGQWPAGQLGRNIETCLRKFREAGHLTKHHLTHTEEKFSHVKLV